jgi:hypothetical protein
MTGDVNLRTADHWWWRPDWAPGRSFYTWHCTFREQPDVRRLARVYRTALGGLPRVPEGSCFSRSEGM